MKLHYYEVAGGNFGDDLNLVLWDRLLPGWRGWEAEATLVGVGTLLRRGRLPPGRKLVIGSGAGYGAPPDVSDPREWDLRAVRGPLTAAALGLPEDRAAVDPAALLPEVEGFAPEELRAGGLRAGELKDGGGEPREILFVPHHASVAGYDWPAICAAAGVGYQTPKADVLAVVRRIARARAVIAESMHAAIVADAYGVPWRAVEITRGFNPFKWEDWARSVGMGPPAVTRFFAPLRHAQDAARGLRARRTGSGGATAGKGGGEGSGAGPRRLAPILHPWAVRHLRAEARGPFALSGREDHARARARLRAILDEVRADHGTAGAGGPDSSGAAT